MDGRAAIRISGEVFGELRSTGSFTNYHLRLHFKWGERKWPPRDAPDARRDSGLLYHVHAAPGAEGRTWARSIEFQIMEQDVGDLYAVGSANAVRARARHGTQPILTSGPIILQSEGAEVFYRDIEIRSITAIPPEFAAAKP